MGLEIALDNKPGRIGFARLLRSDGKLDSGTFGLTEGCQPGPGGR